MSLPLSSPVIPQPVAEAARPRAEAPLAPNDVTTSAAERTPPRDVAGDGTDAIAAAEAVAKAFAGSSNLEVSSFHDEATGRYVTRIADRWSGQVLVQTPPDEILRFLASARNTDPPPVMIDA